MIVNGFELYYKHKGIAYFMKKENGKYAKIRCTFEQLENGDIEFMTEHGLTLSDKAVREHKRKFKTD